MRWPAGFDAYLNPRLLTDSETVTAESVMKYTCWSWSQRTGVRIDYKGLTEQEALDNAAVFRFAESDVYGRYNVNYDFTHGFALWWPKEVTGIEGDYAIAIIGLNHFINGGREFSASIRRTFSHEMGHVIGHKGHLADYSAVMGGRSMIPLRYAPSYADYKDYSTEGCSQTHVELLPDNGLFIPGITSEGSRTVMGADLAYTGDGATHTWRLRHLFPAGEGAPVSLSGVNLDKPDLMLTDIRSQHMGNLSRADLVYIGGETWALHYAG